MEGRVLQKVLLAMLILIVLIGLAVSADGLLEERSKGVQFNYEDSISGHGNFASNNKIIAQGPHADPRMTSRLADMCLQKADHGSGSIERVSIIISNESTKTGVAPV